MATRDDVLSNIVSCLLRVGGVTPGGLLFGDAIADVRHNGEAADPGNLARVLDMTVGFFFNNVETGYVDPIPTQLMNGINSTANTALKSAPAWTDTVNTVFNEVVANA